MAEFVKMLAGPIGTNVYIVWAKDQNKCVVIDPGGGSRNILEFLKDNGLECEAILLTHGHFDHIGAVHDLREVTGAKVYIHEADADMLTDMDKSAASMPVHITPPGPADGFLTDGQHFTAGGLDWHVIHTPGHTPGGVCLLCDDDKIMFSGDTLFNMSIGRTDLGGDFHQLTESLKKIDEQVKGDAEVHPGHMESTSLDFERDNNPYM